MTSVFGAHARSFNYDSRGNVTSNGARSFTYNRANRLTGSGGIIYQYDGHGRRVSKTQGGTKTYSLYNQQGTLLATYRNGNYVEYYHLGQQLVACYNDAPQQADGLGYTGHLEDDDLELTYMQQRYYDPLIGRFYSNDPVGFTANNPMMFNRYAYANNNPYKYVDPDGRAAMAVCAIPPVAAGCAAAQKAIEIVVIGGLLAYNAYNALNESSATDKAIEGIKDGKEPAKGDAGKKGQLEGSGGMSGALEDLGKIPLVEGSEWSKGDSQGGTIDDGSDRKVNVHPSGVAVNS